ncbi:MAG: hypothetical protein Kow00124_24140 [Anaerolineae bacterium]
MKKRFSHYDAQGTDGSDPARLLAVFDVLDDDGLTVRAAIPAAEADGAAREDAALRAGLGKRPPAAPVTPAAAGE